MDLDGYIRFIQALGIIAIASTLISWTVVAIICVCLGLAFAAVVLVCELDVWIGIFK